MDVPNYRRLDGAEVTNQDGERLGKIDSLFVDDRVTVPTWVAVRSGIFGNHHSLVPLAQTRFDDGRLLVPYSKDDLALAPHHDPRPATHRRARTHLVRPLQRGLQRRRRAWAAHRGRGIPDRPHRFSRRGFPPGRPRREDTAGTRSARRAGTAYRHGIAAATPLPTTGRAALINGTRWPDWATALTA